MSLNKNNVKSFIKKHYSLILLYSYIKRLFQNRLIVENKGAMRIRKDIHGRGNMLVVGTESILHSPTIRIRGNNNKIIFGENVRVGKRCSFWLEGNNITIRIGSSTTFTHSCHFCAQEDNLNIIVGEDCMFSNNIIVRTSDSHPIYNDKQQRINVPQSVVIGNHVWIAPHSSIYKGVNISDGAIIASHSLVTHNVGEYELVAGIPAHLIRKNVNWTREALF